MTRWDTVKDLFAQALELPPDRRDAFIDGASGGDTKLRAEVFRMVAVVQPANRFFSQFCQNLGSAAAASWTFLPDEVLAGRFRILRFLASGGMGEVYAARDQELGVDVAIKVLRPGLASRPGMLDQFRTEIRLARAVNSPYVCRVYDVDRHRTGDRGEVSFFSMELLAGEDLRARIRRDGPISPRQARPFIRQMAEGLSAAHKEGVLHRDFKSGNVMICGGESEGSRAVITDFGLARLTHGELQLSEDAATPAYVAPEQLERGEQGTATDVYAFGIVIYEMVTGALPFTGETALEVARKRLSDAPTPPRKHRADLDARWETTILRCLERDPAKRYQDPRDVARALGCYDENSLTRRGWWLAAASALPLGAAAFWNWRAEPVEGPSLAVLPFDVDHPELSYLADGIGDRLTDALTQIPGLRVVARAAAARSREGMRKPADAGRELRVRYLLAGSVKGDARRMRVSTGIVEASTGFQVWSGTEEIGAEQAEGLSARLSRAVVHSLHVDALPAQLSALDKRLTGNPEAYQRYLLGRHYAQEHTSDALKESIAELRHAVDLDPKFAAAYAALGYSYYDLARRNGADWATPFQQSVQAVERALSLDPNLADGYLVVACNKFHFQWDWSGAEQNFQRAIRLNPGLAAAYHSYGDLLNDLGRHEDGLRQIDLAIELDPLNPAIQVTRGTVLSYSGRVNEALEQYQSVVRAHPGYENVYIPLAEAFERKGLLNLAIEACARGAALTKRASYTLSTLARLYGLAGRTSEAEALLSELQDRYRKGDAVAGEIAFAYPGLQDKDHTLEWLERACFTQDQWVEVLKVAPELEFLQADSRYQNLLRRLKL
jgi:eukaryotic-like serine/threonine-protein kinase